jgi:transposase
LGAALLRWRRAAADEDGVAALTPRIRLLIEDLRAEWRALDERIEAFDGEFVRMARDDEAARCLTKILGIGTINATALAAAVGNARAFGAVVTWRRGSDRRRAR